jgi:8-oxo-dGTP pyrophosphatase MutT (NUDIX family)
MPSGILQAAAIPINDGQVCIITSRSGKRWVIPKGCLEPGKTVGDIAQQEAWEEAGVLGLLHPHPVGTYCYSKWGLAYHVTVFLMEVTRVENDWPERLLRRRSWLTPARVLDHISDPGLRQVLRATLAEVIPGFALV